MNPTTMLAGLRTGVGVGGWTAPNLTGRLFGLDPVGNPQSAYLARLFAIRDLALAAGTTQSTGSSRRLWLQLGLLCDFADVGAAVLAARGGTISKPTGVLLGATAASAVAMGIAALASEGE
jgi:hypothetical protein